MINLGFAGAAAILVLHAQDNLSLDEVGFGLLLASAAVGGVIGAISAPRTISRFGGRRSVLAAVIAMAAGVAMMGVANSLWIAGVGFAVYGFAGEIWNIVSVTYRQSVTPDDMLGRVMSGFRVIAYGAFPLGAVIGGLIASAFGLRAAFLVGAGLIAALLLFLIPVTKHHSLEPIPPTPD
jgi:MFS family permease